MTKSVETMLGVLSRNRKRDVIVHGLEGLEDEGITHGRGLDTVREGNVNNVDEERWGKESDSIVVIIRVGKEVGMVR